MAMLSFFLILILREDREWEAFDNSIQFDYEILHSLSFNLTSKVSNETELENVFYIPVKILSICFNEKPDIVISLEMGLKNYFFYNLFQDI